LTVNTRCLRWGEDALREPFFADKDTSIDRREIVRDRCPDDCRIYGGIFVVGDVSHTGHCEWI
jgi:hypothetical protein